MSRKNQLVSEARNELEKSILYYKGDPIGTVAACDPKMEVVNYDQCFVRDFVASALAFLIDGRSEIVRNFTETVDLSEPFIETV